jgi:hypothetical protein
LFAAWSLVLCTGFGRRLQFQGQLRLKCEGIEGILLTTEKVLDTPAGRQAR